jgi:hypothetical protein
MKRSILVFSVVALLLMGALNNSFAQEQPVPKKDTVNMDTDAKPEFYYAIEDEESMEGPRKGLPTAVIVIAGAVVVVGAAAIFLLKKKK